MVLIIIINFLFQTGKQKRSIKQNIEHVAFLDLFLPILYDVLNDFFF